MIATSHRHLSYAPRRTLAHARWAVNPPAIWLHRSNRFRTTIPPVDIHPAARKHGVAGEDIHHAATNAVTIDEQDDNTRLYLGPARSAELLEIVTIVRGDGTELVIHAMKMRGKYQALLPGT